MQRLRLTSRAIAVSAALLVVIGLSGCGMQKAKAVQSAHGALLAALQKHDIGKQTGVKDVSRELTALYDEAKVIPIDDCPEDYQNQFRAVVTSLGDVSATAEKLPDAVGAGDMATFKTKLDAFQTEANKLDDVAKNYITLK